MEANMDRRQGLRGDRVSQTWPLFAHVSVTKSLRWMEAGRTRWRTFSCIGKEDQVSSAHVQSLENLGSRRLDMHVTRLIRDCRARFIVTVNFWSQHEA